VHDLKIHPRERELVLATYGRALWVGDISPLEELTDEILDNSPAGHLFSVTPRARYGFSTQGSNYELYGDKYVRVPNRPDSVPIYYYFSKDAPRATVTIADGANQTVAQLNGPTTKGLHAVYWNLSGGRGGSGPVATGTYRAALGVFDHADVTPIVIRDRTPPRK
jgi:hypothetical protein